MGRRRFIQGGLLGAVLLAGAGWFAYRRKAVLVGVGGPYAVLTPTEAGVLLAAARRIVPPGPSFPSADAVRITERVDAFLAMSHPGVQKDVKRLLSLFDSALFGLALDGSPTRFVTASPAGQDARLDSWATSRLTVRRTGFRAIRRLVCSAYYSSPETWSAIGYPGPPALGTAPPPEPKRGPPIDRPLQPAGVPPAAPAELHPPLVPRATEGAGGPDG